MALRINTNVTALNAHMNLAINDGRLSGSIEKLSSGLRINRAADDAAGLTISEKLRTQVKGINRAIMNVQDGISLIQTAEGALNEIHSMLQRMRELAIQASNDTLTTTDRLEIQKEIAQLKEDINRISYGTEFNTRKLLDGTGTAAISTSSPDNLEGIVTGEVLTFSDFSVVVYPQAYYDTTLGWIEKRGVAQQQHSNIFTKVDGTIASSGTTLQSIANFYDNNGYFILDAPQTLYVQGDNHQGTMVVSKDITLKQLGERMQAAMTTDSLGNGLHFEGSTVVYNVSGENNGQYTVTTGKKGNIGRINFTGNEDLVTALGFQETVLAEDPVYSIAVTNIGVPVGERNTLTTQIAGHRAAGLIQGIDLAFNPPESAFVNTMSAQLGVSIPTAFEFTIDDSTSVASVAVISIPAGRFAMSQIASIINGTCVAENLTVRAKINDSYAIEIYTLNTGSAGYFTISGAPTNVLGIANGKYSGSGGNAGQMTGFQAMTNYDFSSTSVAFTITDMHNLTTNTISIALNANYSGLASLVEALNLQLAVSLPTVRAYDSNGVLQFKSTETGVESNFSIANVANTVEGILFINSGRTTTGFDGYAADQNFAYEQSSTFFGWVVASNAVTVGDDALSFRATDLDGDGFDIAFSAGSVMDGNAFFTITSIANEFNRLASVNGVKLAAEILTGTQQIKLYSTTPGESGRVVLTDLGSPGSDNTLLKTLSVIPATYDNGYGDCEYTMHVKDKFIMFQIGPNQSHSAKANIVRCDVKALGVEDLDLTNIRTAQEAIGLIDKALQIISSERAKLGAIENRMTYTSNSLEVALQNMSASESRIRDVDMAREVIEMTKFQILQQSATAMLAQANTTPQSVLDLLR